MLPIRSIGYLYLHLSTSPEGEQVPSTSTWATLGLRIPEGIFRLMLRNLVPSTGQALLALASGPRMNPRE